MRHDFTMRLEVRVTHIRLREGYAAPPAPSMLNVPRTAGPISAVPPPRKAPSHPVGWCRPSSLLIVPLVP